ncbi:hypothetical protein K4Q81_09745 [Staphylococcus epidermidis]|nr:hypothetical protein [Staphylococcus epidermidis]MCG2186656.1 hypothetical protein [Staphylococcus epidermidis]HDH6993617.1 hypothetical protein [Staphylococcus aureus]
MFKVVTTAIIVALYFVCAIISGAYFDNSDISTVLIPIAFYTLVNIILRNCKQNDGTTRLNDFNDIILFGYALTFIVLKVWLYDKVQCFVYEYNKKIHVKNIFLDQTIATTAIIIFGVAIITIIFILLLPCISKWLNNESHYKV